MCARLVSQLAATKDVKKPAELSQISSQAFRMSKDRERERESSEKTNEG